MSRIGKAPIEIPSNVSIDIKDNQIKVRGPKGELEQKLVRSVKVTRTDNTIKVQVKKPEARKERAFWGLSRSLIFNMIKGVSEGFEKHLEINGIGFKAQVNNSKLVLGVGFSHQVEFNIPKDIEVKVEKNIIIVSGIDKQLVGEIAAQIRKIRPVEPYKGKGLKYVGESVRRKVGKVAKAAGAG